MRYLHPVTMNEEFVASGVYMQRNVDGAPVAEESWTFHEFPDGAWMIRVDHDRRVSGGASVLIEAWRSPLSDGGCIERFDISAFGPIGASHHHVRATYSIVDDSMQIGRTLDRGERVYESLSLTEAYTLYPGGILFRGMAVAAIETGQPSRGGAIFAPEWQFDNKDAFLMQVQTWHAQSTGAGLQVVDGVKLAGVKWSVMTEGSGDELFSGLVDEFGILLAGNDDADTITLSRYARRKDPGG